MSLPAPQTEREGLPWPWPGGGAWACANRIAKTCGPSRGTTPGAPAACPCLPVFSLTASVLDLRALPFPTLPHPQRFPAEPGPSHPFPCRGPGEDLEAALVHPYRQLPLLL